MILVVGATGTVGGHVVAGLTAAGRPVRALTRDAAAAAARLGPGAGPGRGLGGGSGGGPVEVFEGDLGDPAAVREACAGAEAVFVVSVGPDALAHERHVADAVRATGVRRVVKLSSDAALEPAAGSYGEAHAAAERAFAATGAEWTSLRPAGFMTNVLRWRDAIAGDGRIHQPYAHLPRALVDPADVAAAAVVCLTHPGTVHHGMCYQLTGPEALTGPQQVAAVAAAVGRPLECRDLPVTAAVEAMAGAGLPAAYAEGLMAALADPDPRRSGVPHPDLERILGRPGTTFADWLTRHLERLSPDAVPSGGPASG